MGEDTTPKTHQWRTVLLDESSTCGTQTFSTPFFRAQAFFVLEGPDFSFGEWAGTRPPKHITFIKKLSQFSQP